MSDAIRSLRCSTQKSWLLVTLAGFLSWLVYIRFGFTAHVHSSSILDGTEGFPLLEDHSADVRMPQQRTRRYHRGAFQSGGNHSSISKHPGAMMQHSSTVSKLLSEGLSAGTSINGFKSALTKKAITSAVKLIIPEKYESVSATFINLIDDSTAPECNKIISACTHEIKSQECQNMVFYCVTGGFFSANSNYAISDFGQVNAQRAFSNLAVAAKIDSVPTLLRQVAVPCTRYGPTMLTDIFTYFHPELSRETPQHSIICNSIFNKPIPPVQTAEFTAMSEKCAYYTNHMQCDASMSRASVDMDKYFPIYLNLVNRIPQARLYSIGSILDSHSNALQSTLPEELSRSENPEKCMAESTSRVACVAASLLAEACEVSCAVAKCTKRALASQSDCSSSDLYNVLDVSTKICNSMATLLDIDKTSFTCISFATKPVLYGAAVLFIMVAVFNMFTS